MFSCSAYATSDELVTRLRRSVIMYKGKPVFVDGVDGMTLILSHLVTGENFAVSSSDEDLSIESPPLGYVNSDRGALYAMRRPLRLYKQGLCYENLTLKGGRNLRDNMMRSKGFYDMLVGNYPDLQSCLGGASYVNPFAKETSSLKAFHRHLAVDGDNLHYKGRSVGKIRADKTFTLNASCTYLGEEIGEIINEC